MIKKTDEEIVAETIGYLWSKSESPTDTFVCKSVIQAFRLAEHQAEKEITEMEDMFFKERKENVILKGELDKYEEVANREQTTGIDSWLIKCSQLEKQIEDLQLRIAIKDDIITGWHLTDKAKTEMIEQLLSKHKAMIEELKGLNETKEWTFEMIEIFKDRKYYMQEDIEAIIKKYEGK